MAPGGGGGGGGEGTAPEGDGGFHGNPACAQGSSVPLALVGFQIPTGLPGPEPGKYDIPGLAIGN